MPSEAGIADCRGQDDCSTLWDPQQKMLDGALSVRSFERESSSSTAAGGAGTSGRRVARRVLYRCKFCRLKTYVRTDMRHHLMREIGYKPYRCGHCHAAAGSKGTGYSEPSRSAMGKHFRLRHAGKVYGYSSSQATCLTAT